MFIKRWFIKVDQQEVGPLSINDLKTNPHFNPDTLVRKIDWKEWVPARQVPELQILFKDEEKSIDLTEQFKLKPLLKEDEALVLDPAQDPFQNYWFLILVVVLIYLFYHLYMS